MTDVAPGQSATPLDEGSAGWQRTMWAMVVVQFVASSGISILTPIMPLFLPVLGVTDARAIDAWAGVLNFITPFVGAFASPIWGTLADRVGRKPMLLRTS